MGHKYKIVKTLDEVAKVIKYCKQTKVCSHDFESNAEQVTNKTFFPTLLGICFQEGFSYVIPLNHAESPFKDNWRYVLDWIGYELMMDETILKIAFNLKYEHRIWLKYGWDLNGLTFDAMLAKYLLNEERPNDLGSCVKKTFPEFEGYKNDTEQLATKHGWANIPLKELADRNALDADLTLRLMNFYEGKLIDANLYPLFRNLMMPDSRVLAESENYGIGIDKPYLDNLQKSYKDKIDKLELKIRAKKFVRRYERHRLKQIKIKLIEDTREEITYLLEKENKQPSDRAVLNREQKISRYIAGDFQTNKEKDLVEPLNFSSPKQMLDFFYLSKKGFNFPILKETDSGNPSTDEETLLKLQSKDKTGFIAGLLEYRGLEKLYSTYIVGIQERLGDDSKIHGSFLLHGTVTGRLSSRAPNLQNIPRNTTARDIKTMYIPSPGKLILEIDYSQAELRIMAEWAGEEEMLDWFRTGKNVHMATACRMFNVMDRYEELTAVTKNEDHPDHEEWMKKKKKAKMVNFGILYGETAKKLSGQLEESLQKAQEFMDIWFKTFPKIAKKIKAQHKLAERQGFIINWFGRKRRLPNIWEKEYNFSSFLEAQRQSVNAFTQGTSSDYTQMSAILIRKAKLEGLLPKDMAQLYTVHDSIGFDIYPKDIHKAVPIIQKICEEAGTKKYFSFEMKKVKMGVNAEVGVNWAELRDYRKDEDYTSWLSK